MMPERAIHKRFIDGLMLLYCDFGKVELTEQAIQLLLIGIISLTSILMPPSFSSQSKRDALLRAGALHPHPDQVTHSLFRQSPFFDPHDLLQVKYEALRAWEAGEDSVCSLARHFALSRPTLYAARSAFRDYGLPGLLPGKRGPKGAHKLTEEVLDHVRVLLAKDPSLTPSDILECLRDDLGVALHLRTLEKALNEQRHLKKGRLTT